MSGNKAQGFLEAIVAQPDEDAPRLIFADWLEEQGDGARAEFIRVQIERARLPEWDARQVRLRLRERELLEQHGQKWKGELPSIEGVGWEEFRRGFVAAATVASFALLATKANPCWAATPIEAATIRWPRQAERLERIPPIGGLRELSITGQLIDHGDVSRLANASLLSTLRTLNLRGCNLGGTGFRRLVASPHLGNLTALRVPGNAIGNAAIRALFDAVSLSSLAELDLSEAGSYGRTRRSGRYREDPVLEAVDLRALAAWSALARLRSLTLSGNAVGREGLCAAAIAAPDGLEGVDSAGQRARWSGDAGVRRCSTAAATGGSGSRRELAGRSGAGGPVLAPCLDELKVLQLDRCEIRLSGAQWLARAKFVGSLRRLNVNHNSFGPEGLYALLHHKPPELHSLFIANNDLGDEGASHLAESAASNSLLEVDLSENGLGEAAGRALAKSKQLRQLLILRWFGNSCLSKETSFAFVRSRLGKQLAVLEGAGLAGGVQF